MTRDNILPPTQGSESDDSHDLRSMGYAQELLRDMGGFSNFAMSFSIISILTGAIQLYGYGLNHGGPLVMSLGWAIVSLGTCFVALSMAELASAYPTAGALYHWASVLGGRGFGWFTACWNTIGQFAIVAGIDYGLAQLMNSVLNLGLDRGGVVGLYIAILASHAVLNHLGIRTVARLTAFSAWYHIAVVGILLTSLAIVGFTQPLSFLTVRYQTDGYAYPYSFLIGCLLAQWTLTGFDASAHLTEETRNPRKTAPWGIILAVLISAVFGGLMLAGVTLSIPNISEAAALGDGAFAGILRMRLGEGLGTILTMLILGAMWLCGLSSLTSASRMVYAFARDGGVPCSRFFARINPRYKTPAAIIWTLSGCALLLVASVQAYSAVVSIATIALYISYGLPIAALLIAKISGKHPVRGPWHLGIFSTPCAILALLWVLGICIVFVLPPNEQAGYIVAGLITLLGLGWVTRARRRFVGPAMLREKTPQ